MTEVRTNQKSWRNGKTKNIKRIRRQDLNWARTYSKIRTVTKTADLARKRTLRALKRRKASY